MSPMAGLEAFQSRFSGFHVWKAGLMIDSRCPQEDEIMRVVGVPGKCRLTPNPVFFPEEVWNLRALGKEFCAIDARTHNR